MLNFDTFIISFKHSFDDSNLASIKYHIATFLNNHKTCAFSMYGYIWLLIYIRHLLVLKDTDAYFLAFKVFFTEPNRLDNMKQFEWFKKELKNLMDQNHGNRG